MANTKKQIEEYINYTKQYNSVNEFLKERKALNKADRLIGDYSNTWLLSWNKPIKSTLKSQIGFLKEKGAKLNKKEMNFIKNNKIEHADICAISKEGRFIMIEVKSTKQDHFPIHDYQLKDYKDNAKKGMNIKYVFVKIENDKINIFMKDLNEVKKYYTKEEMVT